MAYVEGRIYRGETGRVADGIEVLSRELVRVENTPLVSLVRWVRDCIATNPHIRPEIVAHLTAFVECAPSGRIPYKRELCVLNEKAPDREVRLEALGGAVVCTSMADNGWDGHHVAHTRCFGITLTDAYADDVIAFLYALALHDLTYTDKCIAYLRAFVVAMDARAGVRHGYSGDEAEAAIVFAPPPVVRPTPPPAEAPVQSAPASTASPSGQEQEQEPAASIGVLDVLEFVADVVEAFIS